MPTSPSQKNKTVWLLIRVAIAFAFFYPAIKIHIDPDSWLSYFPPFIKTVGIPQIVILYLFTAVHLAIGIWILSGKRIFIPCLLATLFLAGLILTNLSQMDILFRDVSLLLITLALAIQSKNSSPQIR
ncbi:MAG: hypothetical protein ABI430_02135 [Candidatus Taylorbacteria bacterium]